MDHLSHERSINHKWAINFCLNHFFIIRNLIHRTWYSFCYDIGVKLVGHRREGVLLKATTGRNMLGGLNTLTSQEQAQAAWYVCIELILKLQLWSIHRKRRNLQRKGMRPEKEKNMQNERASMHDVQTALHKYNRANNTMVRCYLFCSSLFGNCHLKFEYSN